MIADFAFHFSEATMRLELPHAALELGEVIIRIKN